MKEQESQSQPTESQPEPTAPAPQEFSNNEVHLKVHKRPACRIEFEIEALPVLVKAAHEQAIKRVAKQISLPGFRKGKAPSELVLKNYPKDVDKQWQDVIATMSYQASAKLSKIPLLHKDSKINFKMKTHSLQEGAKLTLTFETEPEIPSVDPSKLKLKEVPRPETDAAKVDETIRQILFFFAEWKNVSDRPVKIGDFVLLDVDLIEETPPKPLFSHTRFEVTEKGMATWMRELVLEKKVGDELEGTSIPDADATAEEKETLKPKKVKVKIKALEEATLPVLDDAFALKLGVANIADLRTSLKGLLDKQADEHVKEKLRDQVNEFLLTEYAFDLPVTLIEKETQFRMQQLMGDKQFQAYWNQMKEDERRKTVQSIYHQSEKAVRMFYLCRKIVSDGRISVTPKDLPLPPQTPLEVLMNPGYDFHPHHQPEVRQAETFSRMVLEKAEDYLIAEASKSST